jgi:hypothetical protein
MKKSLLIIIAILTLIIAMCGCCQNNKLVGSISVFSNGEEYTPVSNWIFSLENRLAGDGMRKRPDEVSADLAEIPLSDDFKIVIDGKTTGNVTYTLFNENNEEMYFRDYEFKKPSESGVYILLIEIAWGNKNRYEGYQYFFKLVK